MAMPASAINPTNFVMCSELPLAAARELNNLPAA
jgi:hypothetical protein